MAITTFAMVRAIIDNHKNNNKLQLIDAKRIGIQRHLLKLISQYSNI